MNSDEITLWAKLLASKQKVGLERVPIDRVIAAHLATFETLRAMGLTWPSIAAILMRAGLRRKDGSPVPSDQLRADFSRVTRRHSIAAKSSNISLIVMPAISLAVDKVGSTQHEGAPVNSNEHCSIVAPDGSTDNKLVSANELNKALLRLKKV